MNAGSGNLELRQERLFVGETYCESTTDTFKRKSKRARAVGSLLIWQDLLQ